MEEKLDKLISLMETQNKAWERSLQLLNGMHTLMVEKYKSADLLLEQHPPMMGPSQENQPASERPTAPINASARPRNFNDYSDDTPYGVELEEERAPEVQSFPVPSNAVVTEEYRGEAEEEAAQSQLPPPTTSVGREEVHQAPQPAFRDPPPTVPVTSKAEMMEQVEKKPEL